MPDQNGQETTQESTTPVSTATTQQPAQTTTAQVPGNSAGQETEDEFDKERAMATIKKLREFEKTAKTALKELDTLKAEKQAVDDAKLSESERLQKQLNDIAAKAQEAEAKRTEIERELLTERRTSRTARIAGSLGAIDPTDANILAATATIDPNSERVDDEIKQAVEVLKTAKPYLFQSAQAQQPQSPRLESFNPGNAGGSAKTDEQRVQDLYRRRGSASSPLG